MSSGWNHGWSRRPDSCSAQKARESPPRRPARSSLASYPASLRCGRGPTPRRGRRQRLGRNDQRCDQGAGHSPVAAPGRSSVHRCSRAGVAYGALATSRNRPVLELQVPDTTTCTVVANWRRRGVMVMMPRILSLSRGPRHGRELCRGRFHDRLTALVLRPREHDLVAVNGDARVATGSCARYCRHGGDWRRAT